MSDEEKPFEFSARDLMPDWAQESKSVPEKSFPRRFDREEGENERRGGGGPRGERRGGFGGRREGGDRRDNDRRGGRPDARGGFGGNRGGDRHGRGGQDRVARDRPREETPAADVSAQIEPTKQSIEGLTKHIKETFRSFPLADLAKMILAARERYQVKLTRTGGSLFHCPSDGSVWLTREEAVAHLLNGPALENFYEIVDVEIGAPAGNFSSVAVCGMSGTILGPPNHHEYQRNIVRLHQERFSNMPLERFKSRIRMESGEEAIEKWKAQVSRARHYRLKSEDSPDEAVSEKTVEEEPLSVPLPEPVEELEGSSEIVEIDSEDEAVAGEDEASVEEETAPAEPPADEENVSEPEKEEKKIGGLVLKNFEELTRHFRQNFADDAVRECAEVVVMGSISGRSLSPGLLAHLKQEGERLRRGFQIEMIQTLCRDLEKKNLKFFKRGKKSLHVSAVRPKAVDPTVSLTEQIQQIIDLVIATPRITVMCLLEGLVPDFKKPEATSPDGAIELSDEAKTVLKNLRWLTSEGYVLEFPDTSLVIGREPQKEGAESAAPAKKKLAKKKKTAPVDGGKETKTEEYTTKPSSGDDEIETDDAPVVLDASEENADDSDELPEEVNPVETT